MGELEELEELEERLRLQCWGETLEMNQVVIFHKYILDIFRSDKTVKGVTYYSCQKTERNKKKQMDHSRTSEATAPPEEVRPQLGQCNFIQ